MIRRYLPDLDESIATLVEWGVYGLYETREGRYILATDKGALYGISSTGDVSPIPIEASLGSLSIVAVVYPDRRAQGVDVLTPIVASPQPSCWERVRSRAG